MAADDPDRYIDRVDLARWTQLVERLKALRYTPWLSANELARFGDAARNRELLREFENWAEHLESRGY